MGNILGGMLPIKAENYLDRSEAKWAHPLLKDAWENEGIPTLSASYDFTVPREEKLAQYKATREMFQNPDFATQSPDKEPVTQEARDYSEKLTFEVSGCPEEEDAPPVTVVVYAPKDRSKKYPVILYLPGGGLVSAFAGMFDKDLIKMSYRYKAVVVCPDYRTVLQDLYPAPINDCHAVYKWIVENTENLPVDPDNVTIGGISSGAHIALSLGFRLKRYGYQPRGIVAMNPITDDRMNKTSSRYFTYPGDWDGHCVKECSVAYLGPYRSGSSAVGPEAFANYATVEQCKGYAPTFIETVEFDPDRDYCSEFARKLQEAGTFVEYHCFGGGSHSSTALDSSGIDEYTKVLMEPFNRAFGWFSRMDFRRPWIETD